MMHFDNIIEFRELLQWGSTDGKTRLVKDMADSHVVNVLNWIFDRPSDYDPELHGWFEKEAEYRKVICFAQGKPVPTKDENTGRWFLLSE